MWRHPDEGHAYKVIEGLHPFFGPPWSGFSACNIEVQVDYQRTL